MNPKPRTDAECNQYLVRALQINPLQNANGLLKLRRQFHGITEDRVRDDAKDIRAQREETATLLDQLRENFWSMKPTELAQALANIQAGPFPDLKSAVDRLQTLAEFRPLLAQLSQDKHFDGELFSSLKRVLVLPPREAEGVREKTLKSLDSRPKLKRTRRMIALLQREAPEVFALEKAWFNRLDAAKQTSAGTVSSSSATSDGSGFSLGGLGWAGGVLVLILARLILKGLLWSSHE